ncbi:hypothetical protein VPH35_009038 [Triticum aestivum]
MAVADEWRCGALSAEAWDGEDLHYKTTDSSLYSERIGAPRRPLTSVEACPDCSYQRALQDLFLFLGLFECIPLLTAGIFFMCRIHMEGSVTAHFNIPWLL